MDVESLRTWLESSRTADEALFFFLALVLAFGTLQTTGSLLNTDRPVVTVTSCSMYPSLDAGDIVIVQGKKLDDISKGEIAVYSTEEVAIPVIHRVVNKSEDSLGTKGDNTPRQYSFDKGISPKQVYGTSVLTVPKVGLAKLIASDITGVGALPGAGKEAYTANSPLLLESSVTPLGCGS